MGKPHVLLKLNNKRKKKGRILVIDDNQYILKPLGLLLSGSGYSVTLATNGQEVSMTKISFKDLILLDSRLKGIKGQDICRKIKQDKKTQHIPIIMCSADSKIKIIAKEAGADDFIKKPINITALLKKIKKYI